MDADTLSARGREKAHSKAFANGTGSSVSVDRAPKLLPNAISENDDNVKRKKSSERSNVVPASACLPTIVMSLLMFVSIDCEMTPLKLFAVKIFEVA